jgi:hypothetical protein
VTPCSSNTAHRLPPPPPPALLPPVLPLSNPLSEICILRLCLSIPLNPHHRVHALRPNRFKLLLSLSRLSPQGHSTLPRLFNW